MHIYAHNVRVMVSLVVFDVQIIDPYSLTGIDILFIGVVSPQWCIQARIMVCPGRHLFDDLKGRLSGEGQFSLSGSGGRR